MTSITNQALETLPPGWNNARVTYSWHGKEKRKIQILDSRSGMLYMQEPMAITAFKCFLLTFAVPFYFVGYTLLHLLRLPLVTLCNCSPVAFFKQLWKIVKIPFHWIGMQFAALYGIFKPLEGRAVFGKVEKSLHDGKSRLEAVGYWKIRFSCSKFFWMTLLNRQITHSLFIGFCMQSLAKIPDRRITRVELLPAPPAA